MIIATTTRAFDFFESGRTNHVRLTYLVLDETAQMFDVDYAPQLRSIIGKRRPDRKPLVFTAALPKDMVNIFRDNIMGDYAEVHIQAADLTVSTDITQIVQVIDSDIDKIHCVVAHLQVLSDSGRYALPRILVFAETQRKADEINSALLQVGINAVSLHEGKNQVERNRASNDFRYGHAPVMVPTDGAARLFCKCYMLDTRVLSFICVCAQF